MCITIQILIPPHQQNFYSFRFADYDLTVDDLFSANVVVAKRRGRAGVGLGGEGRVVQSRRGRPVGSVSRKPVPVRYRDEAGHTWTGRGKQPNWLRAHIEAGRDIEQYRVAEAE